MDKILAQLRGNLRLRMALALIVAIVWWSYVQGIQDRAQQQRVAYRQAANQLARLDNPAALGEWPKRAEAAKLTQVDAQSRLWRFASIGLAQASLQDSLVDTLTRAKAKSTSITLVENSSSGAKAAGKQGKGEDADHPAIPLVHFKVVFDFDQAVLHTVLADLAASKQMWIVDGLAVRIQFNSRAELDVSAPIVLNAKGDKP
jgi:hypothetical protein